MIYKGELAGHFITTLFFKPFNIILSIYSKPWMLRPVHNSYRDT